MVWFHRAILVVSLLKLEHIVGRNELLISITLVFHHWCALSTCPHCWFHSVSFSLGSNEIKSCSSPPRAAAKSTETSMTGSMNKRAGRPVEDMVGANSQATHPNRYPPMDTTKSETRLSASTVLELSNRLTKHAKMDGKTASPRPSDPPRRLPIFVISKPG